MKVALLGPYPPEGHLAGGVDAVVWALAGGLADRPIGPAQGPYEKIELHVLTAAAGGGTATVQQVRPGLTLHQVPLQRGDRLLWHWPFVRALVRTLRAIAPDVVHAHGTGPYAAAALGCGRPAVITPHGIIFREAALALGHSPRGARLRWVFDAWYERWLIGRARDLIAISPYVIEEYRLLTRARFHLIENPVADAFFDVPAPRSAPLPPKVGGNGGPGVRGADVPAPRSAPLPPKVGGNGGWGARGAGGPILLCVARLIPRKDILTLLHAFARVHAAVPGAQLEIVGQTDADPPYTRACLATVAELGLEESVRFLGERHGAGLVACYARADLVLLTSRQETAPVVVAEAMAAGRPVVATRVGGTPYMVADGQTGLLADAGDPQGLAEAAIALLTQPERRRAFGEAGRAVAWERFRLEVAVQRTVELYNGMIKVDL